MMRDDQRLARFVVSAVGLLFVVMLGGALSAMPCETAACSPGSDPRVVGDHKYLREPDRCVDGECVVLYEDARATMAVDHPGEDGVYISVRLAPLSPAHDLAVITLACADQVVDVELDSSGSLALVIDGQPIVSAAATWPAAEMAELSIDVDDLGLRVELSSSLPTTIWIAPAALAGCMGEIDAITVATRRPDSAVGVDSLEICRR
jgi:hypothetical protein